MIEPKEKPIEHSQAEVRKAQHKTRFTHRMHVHRGHRLFVFDGEKVSEVETQTITSLGADGKVRQVRKAQRNPKHWYMPALNLKNAIKRFKKARLIPEDY